MTLFRSMLDALFRERNSTTVTVTLPTPLFMALETLVYLKNESIEDDTDEISRDYIIGVALAQFLSYHLGSRNEERIVAIPTPPPDDQYTQGRRQSRANVVHYNR